MVQTFILTRTFAISALFVGALPVSYAAPIPRNAASSAVAIAPRWCHQIGCLFADPTANSDASNSTGDDKQSVLSAGSLEVIDFLISALTNARNSATSETAAAVVDLPVAAVTVDGFVDPISTIAEELSSRVEEASAPVVERAVMEREIEESAELDALV